MIQIQKLTFAIADRNLLKNMDWVIKAKKRIGLIGPNGAGKTTLFRLLTGEYQPTEGSLQIPRNCSIGYLPQEEIQFEPKPILNIVLEGHEELLDLEQEINKLRDEVSKSHNATLIEKLGRLEDQFNLLGGYQLESDAKKVLSGLRFSEKDFLRPVQEFSGGWRMRVHLARLLLQRPDYLLMDEPTNHLDIHSLEWLEEYLQTFPGTIILISHDRYFLDRLATEIAALENGKIKVYSGNYHFYELKKNEENEQLIKTYEAQKAERDRIQKFIDRFRYKATKAAQVQSRVKMLEKMEEVKLPEQKSNFSFKIKADVQSYKEVLDIRDISFAYDNKPIFTEFNLKAIRGEKIALVGDNGEGKTTLTKLIYGDLKVQGGSVNIGERVKIGYYAQHQTEALNLTKTIMEEVEETAADSFRVKLRDILGLFRFHGDDVNKKIKVLSGGEKARVSLAKILLSPCNFLIMDEPTNHLDMASKDALEIALQGYDGTLLIISHDRHFLDRLVKRVIEIKDQKLYDYPGNYTYYMEKRKELIKSLDKTNNSGYETQSNDNQNVSNRKSKDQKRLEAEARKVVSKQRNDLQKRIEQIESDLDIKVGRKHGLETLLADPTTYNDAAKSAGLNKEYKELESEIKSLEFEWEDKHLKLEQLLKNIQ